MTTPVIEPLVRAVHDSLRAARRTAAARFLAAEREREATPPITPAHGIALAALRPSPVLAQNVSLRVDIASTDAHRPGAPDEQSPPAPQWLEITAAATPGIHTVARLNGVVIARMNEGVAAET